MRLLSCWTVSLLSLTAAFPFLPAAVEPSTPRPLVLWHGLGDSAYAKGILEFIDMIQEIHPGIYVYAVHLAENESDDRKAGFFGRLHDQLAIVYEQLNGVPELAGGFDGMGFSQGGLFLRAYAEVYNSPPMHNLITFGSPHMGVSELPDCNPYDFFCRMMHSLGKGRVYTDWAQKNVVPAQYFRDTSRYATYLQRNHFLPLINNEIASSFNRTYATNFASLHNLVLIQFGNDTILEPKQSSWFESYEIPEEGGDDGAAWIYEDREINDVNLADEDWEDVFLAEEDLATTRKEREPLKLISMKNQPLYKEDWIGLRQLDERGVVVRLTCEGQHMHISRECWEPLVVKYVGGVDVDSPDPAATRLRIQSD